MFLAAPTGERCTKVGEVRGICNSAEESAKCTPCTRHSVLQIVAMRTSIVMIPGHGGSAWKGAGAQMTKAGARLMFLNPSGHELLSCRQRRLCTQATRRVLVESRKVKRHFWQGLQRRTHLRDIPTRWTLQLASKR